jgi:ferredoxin-type protein NapF
MGYDRRNFLKKLATPLDRLGNAISERTVPRPPYSSGPESFGDQCASCEGFCRDACPEKIIVMDPAGAPTLDFSSGGCTFCEECAKACPHEVLKINGSALITAVIQLDHASCMAWNNVICTSCGDACQESAISFERMRKPQIDLEKCTRCGFCLRRCPVQSITIHKRWRR